MHPLLRCSRYAFGPNRLHYCGPNASSEVFAYIENNVADEGLSNILQKFETMYPYLERIAVSNNIRNPLDPKVVDAYWIGNPLLDHITKQELFSHLADGLQIKKKITPRKFRFIEKAIANGGIPHHSFHVFNIWRRTGNLNIAHTLQSMDECRISWGKVLKVDGPFITVETKPLVIHNDRLTFGTLIQKRITRNLESDVDIDAIRVGDFVSMHWSVPCEIISKEQTMRLDWYTRISMKITDKKL